MVATWIGEEVADVRFGDKRLDRRLQRVLSDLSDRPTASIPAACGGHNELTAAYRLFDNDKVTHAKILEPHCARTRQRIAEQPVVLLVQDTTEIDVTRPQQQVKGAGPMDGSARRGAFLHALEAFTPDGTPLGTVWTDIWTRDEAALTESAADKRKRLKATPIEEKESYRWLQGLRQSQQIAEQCPLTTCICVGDSEADIYELFAEPRGTGPAVHWLIRLCHDRSLDADSATEARSLCAQVLAQPVLFTKQITVRGRQPKVGCEERGRRQARESRSAEVAVRATSVTLRPPPRPDRVLPPVTVQVVLVREVNPPAGEEPVEWLLVTTLSIASVAEVRQIIQYYCVRWMIEVLFRTLKSGCRVEERRFEELERLLPCLAVYLIAAWRTLLVCRMGRSCPDISCEAVFEPCEWKSVWIAVKGAPPPQEAPRLGELVCLVAQLGGYVHRPKRSDPPGPQTLWLGMQRMRDLAWAWDLFGPGAKRKVV
jgi:hypothetical protein